MSWLRTKSLNPDLPADEQVETPVESADQTAFPQPTANRQDDETQKWLDSLVSQSDPRLVGIKRGLHQQVISSLDISAVGKWSAEQLRVEVRRQAEQVCRERNDLLNTVERERIVDEVMDEAFGLGPLEPLRKDPKVTDILINGPKTIYVERGGRLVRTPITFHDDKHLIQIVQRIASQVGRRIDETCPMVDARLPDGSRLNAVIAPLALDGALVSIRRFGSKPLTVDRLVGNQSITQEMVDFLEAAVKARVNIVVSGGTGSGKTTLLNCLSGFIPEDERVATIEDAAELRLQQPHVVRMETRTANVEGTGEVTTRDLMRNALRMRPDRIIVGECRGSEALDMLQAMNTGHEGSLTTVHANTTRDAVSRLEMMVGMAGFDLPIWIIRKQMASAIHIVLQVSRLMGGVRKVTRISEITGMEGDVLSMQDLFEFKQTGVDANRVAKGYYAACGIRSSLIERIESCGLSLPSNLFDKRVLMKCEGRVSP